MTDWQKILSEGFATSAELMKFLHLPVTLSSEEAEKIFKTRVPRGFAARMQPGNPNDPLLLQVLACQDELIQSTHFEKDPLQERKFNPHRGLIHKYHGRVLLTLTGVCAIHCRYCFRRHFPYDENNPGRKGWAPVFDYIAADSNIFEVILSGGDPLLAKDAVFKELLESIAAIDHVKILRIHTRIPVVLPERVNQSLLQILEASRLQKVVVIHSNHANELDDSVGDACKQLQRAGCHVLNQSVLLNGVNDNVEALDALCRRLFDYGVLPYYLHLLDKVQGAEHFEIIQSEAVELHRQLLTRLPGYLVPRLVQEVAGEKNKIPVFA